MRREWIEIPKLRAFSSIVLSPSMRREWIEMFSHILEKTFFSRLPPCGGSGLKSVHKSAAGLGVLSLPPCGGSGLKCFENGKIERKGASPSMRREWIEIFLFCFNELAYKSPSMRREWIEIDSLVLFRIFHRSPSMRREWIEIFSNCFSAAMSAVSLHAEGVD